MLTYLLTKYGAKAIGTITASVTEADGNDTAFVYSYQYFDHREFVHSASERTVYDPLWIAHASRTGEIQFDWHDLEKLHQPGAPVTIYYWPLFPSIHIITYLGKE
jgi:hypothetical protein